MKFESDKGRVFLSNTTGLRLSNTTGLRLSNTIGLREPPLQHGMKIHINESPLEKTPYASGT